MTGIALMIRGPAHNFPGAVEFVIAVLVIILAIFFRMYGPRRRSGPRLTRADVAAERAAEHGHRSTGRPRSAYARPCQRALE